MFLPSLIDPYVDKHSTLDFTLSAALNSLSERYFCVVVQRALFVEVIR